MIIPIVLFAFFFYFLYYYFMRDSTDDDRDSKQIVSLFYFYFVHSLLSRVSTSAHVPDYKGYRHKSSDSDVLRVDPLTLQ